MINTNNDVASVVACTNHDIGCYDIHILLMMLVIHVIYTNNDVASVVTYTNNNYANFLTHINYNVAIILMYSRSLYRITLTIILLMS